MPRARCAIWRVMHTNSCVSPFLCVNAPEMISNLRAHVWDELVWNMHLLLETTLRRNKCVLWFEWLPWRLALLIVFILYSSAHYFCSKRHSFFHYHLYCCLSHGFQTERIHSTDAGRSLWSNQVRAVAVKERGRKGRREQCTYRFSLSKICVFESVMLNCFVCAYFNHSAWFFGTTNIYFMNWWRFCNHGVCPNTGRTDGATFGRWKWLH